MFVSGSKDGSVKIWDGLNVACAQTISKAHNGQEITSTVFSKNSKYLLTSGRDYTARLWDVTNGMVKPVVSPRMTRFFTLFVNIMFTLV